MNDPVLNSLEDGSRKEAGVESSYTTPNKIKSLLLPFSPQLERRASPRAEEMLAKKLKGLGKPQTTRMRLPRYHSFEHAVELLKKSSNIVVLTGAGISTAVGIPDFRSDKGLYHKLKRDLGFTTPEEFFSKEYFIDNPVEFFQYVKDIIPEVFPTPDGGYQSVSSKKKKVVIEQPAYVPKYSQTHAFLAFLHSQNKLLTNYTQNIDGLETAAGLPASKFIQCHGSWDTASCMTCGKVYKARRYLPVVFDNNKPMCKCYNLPAPKPRKRSKVKAGQKRKRRREEDGDSDHSSDAFDAPQQGLLKPNITFFDDNINDRYRTTLDSDKTEVDLLVIIGTSLKVAPIQTMLYKIPSEVPQIYISKERFSGALCSLPGVQVDIELLGDADLIIGELCKRAGWNKGLRQWLWRDAMTKVHSNDVIDKAPKRSQPSPHETNLGTIQVKTEHNYTEQPRDSAMSNTCHSVPELMESKPAGEGSNHRKAENMSQVLHDHSDDIKIELEEGTTHRWLIKRK